MEIFYTTAQLKKAYKTGVIAAISAVNDCVKFMLKNDADSVGFLIKNDQSIKRFKSTDRAWYEIERIKK